METQTILLVIALITAAASACAVIKFWMDFGETKQQATAANSHIALISAKFEIFQNQVAENRVQDAKLYATTGELVEVERRIATSIDAMRVDFRGMADHLNKLLIELVRARGGEHVG